VIPITEDIGAREGNCAICGKVIGIVDFIVRCGPNTDLQPVQVWIDFVHLDCDAGVKAQITELRAARHTRNGDERKPTQ